MPILLNISFNSVVAIIASVILVAVLAFYMVRFIIRRNGEGEFHKLTEELAAKAITAKQ